MPFVKLPPGLASSLPHKLELYLSSCLHWYFTNLHHYRHSSSSVLLCAMVCVDVELMTIVSIILAIVESANGRVRKVLWALLLQ